jgi:WD40 repeat protein
VYHEQGPIGESWVMDSRLPSALGNFKDSTKILRILFSFCHHLTMQIMTELIKKDCIIGVNTSVKSVHALDSNKVLYCSSNHVVIWMKSEKKQTFVHHCSPRERIQHIELCSSRRTIAIVIIGQDGAYIIFYDASTLQRKKVIQPNDGIPERILGLSFSKDGKECLILGDEPEYVLSIWNVEKIPSILASVNLATPSGKEIRQASLCPSDGRLVSVSGNGIIRFFRIIDNIFRPVTVKLRGKQQDYIQHCWLKNDSIMLATTNELIVVCNFEMETAIPMEGWDQDLVSISPLARGILIGGSKGSIRLYHAVVENSFTELKLTRSISFDVDANVLAFDSIESENVAICLVGSGRICTVLLSNFVPLHAEDAVSIVDTVPSLVQMEATGNQKIFLDICSWKTTLAIGTPNNTIRIWDYSNKMFDLLHLCKDEIVSLSLHPMGLQVLICTETGVELSAVNYSSLSLRWRHDLSTNGGSCFSNGGHYFALLIGEFVQVYDTFTQNLISTLRGHTAYVQSVCWKDDDVQIATIGRDGVICTWDTWTGDRTSRISKIVPVLHHHLTFSFEAVQAQTNSVPHIYRQRRTHLFICFLYWRFFNSICELRQWYQSFRSQLQSIAQRLRMAK